MNDLSRSQKPESFFPGRLGTRTELNDLLAQRWSPRAFSPRSVEPEKIVRLFEAARWSPSSMNEQPWRFVVATKDDAPVYDALYAILSEGNRQWADRAPVLVLAVAQSTFSKNGKPNRHFLFDLGQAVANLTVEAVYLNLAVHQMGGFDKESAREFFSLPPEFEPVVVLAVGYGDRPETLPEGLREREESMRSRRPLETLVFTDTWNVPSPHVESDLAPVDQLSLN